MDEMRPADYAAINGGGFGNMGDSWLWIIVLFLFAGGWNGGMNRGGAAAQEDVYRAIDQQTLLSKMDGNTYGIADATYALNNAINGVNQNLNTGFSAAELSRCNGQATILAQLNNMAADNASCCCQTQRQIESGFANLNYNIATQSCETRQAIADGTKAILDYLTTDKISTLTAENNGLKAQLSQNAQNALLTNAMAAQTAQLINAINPTPVPAYTVPNPNAPYCTGCC